MCVHKFKLNSQIQNSIKPHCMVCKLQHAEMEKVRGQFLETLTANALKKLQKHRRWRTVCHHIISMTENKHRKCNKI